MLLWYTIKWLNNIEDVADSNLANSDFVINSWKKYEIAIFYLLFGKSSLFEVKLSYNYKDRKIRTWIICKMLHVCIKYVDNSDVLNFKTYVKVEKQIFCL